MTNYPDSLDNIITLPTVSGSSQEVIAINALREATLAIETELGISPSGVYSDTRSRLDILETRINYAIDPPVLSENLPIVNFSSIVDLSEPGRAYYNGENNNVFILGLDGYSGFLPNINREYFIPAGMATSIIIADNIDPDSSFDSFDPAANYFIAITTITDESFISIGKSIPILENNLPTIVSLTVDASNPDLLVAVFSTTVHLPFTSSNSANITGLSIGGVMSVARTIVSVASGNGTNTINFNLSGSLIDGDAPTFIIDIARELRSLNGSKIAVGTTNIILTGFEYDWSAVANVSMWRKADSIALSDGAAIPSWTGQNPPAAIVSAEATNRPAYRTSKAPANLPAVDFDGTNDLLQTSSATITTLIGAASTAYFYCAAVVVDSAGAEGNTYDSEAFWSDTVGWVGFHISTTGGQYRVVAYAYDGATKYAYYEIGPSLPTSMVVHCRMSGGNLYAGVNGVEGAPVACGAVSASGDALLVNTGKASTAKFLDGAIYEDVFIKSGDLQTAGIASMVSRYV